MKPSFALNFTDDSIGLLHRTSRGWLEVGSVPLDEPDLGQAVAYLRGSALGLEPRGITTKLVIPNSQIRYMTLKAPGPDAASRRSQIKAELEGRTPYPVDDLVFDWWGKGATVQVAVVARETLDEAEAFARDNRLNPLSFVAIPEPGTFGAEPWFGASGMAATVLMAGEKVDRDQDPIQIVGRLPRTEATAGPDTEPSATADTAPPNAPPGPDAVVPGTAAEPALIANAEPTAPDVAPESAAPAEPPPEVAQTAPTDVTADRIVDGVPDESLTDTPAPAPRDRPTTPAPAESVIAAPPAPEPAPVPPLLRIPPANPPAAASLGAVVTDPRLTKKQPAPTSRPPAKPATRLPEPAKRPTATSGSPRLSAIPGGGGGTRGGKFTMPIPEAEWPLERVTSAARVAQGKTDAARGGSMITAPSIPMQRERKLSIVPPAAREGQDGTAADAARARSAGEPKTVFGAQQPSRRGKPRFLGLILTVLLLVILAAIATWASFFLASNGDGAKPAVASAPDSGIAAPSPLAADTTALPAPDAAPEATADATDPTVADTATEPEPDDEMLADGQDPEALADQALSDPSADPSADLVATDTATAAPAADDAIASTTSDAPIDPAAALPAASAAPGLAADTRADETPSPAAPEPVVPAVESATVAVPDTSAVSARTPTDEPQDEIFLAMIDPALATTDAIALATPVAATDAEPLSQPAPPPFGTVYQFDAEGRIIPTRDGIITPEGVRLVAGPPPLVPPARPVISAEPAAVDQSAEPAVEPAAAEPAYADPALAGARPRARPEALVPAAATATDDAATLIPTDAPRISSLKPRARPPEILARGEAARAAEDAARNAATTAAVQAAAASLVIPPDGAGSPLAIAVSRKPAPRPRDFNREIDAAVAVAAADATLTIALPDPPAKEAAKEPAVEKDPVVEEQPASFASASPSDDPAIIERDEPERISVAPKIPTRASVAKQATDRNAINLGRTNLIGVYGTSSNRYAMVRQPNGRFVKVEVGDRIDGGSVAAISERQLNYVKDGQIHTLSMPRG